MIIIHLGIKKWSRRRKKITITKNKLFLIKKERNKPVYIYDNKFIFLKE